MGGAAVASASLCVALVAAVVLTVSCVIDDDVIDYYFANQLDPLLEAKEELSVLELIDLSLPPILREEKLEAQSSQNSHEPKPGQGLRKICRELASFHCWLRPLCGTNHAQTRVLFALRLLLKVTLTSTDTDTDTDTLLPFLCSALLSDYGRLDLANQFLRPSSFLVTDHQNDNYCNYKYRLCQVFTAFLATAIVYHFADPDDSECYEHHRESECSADFSSLYWKDKRCRWTGQICQFRKSSESVSSIAVAAFLSACVCAWVNVFFDALLVHTVFKYTRRDSNIGAGVGVIDSFFSWLWSCLPRQQTDTLAKKVRKEFRFRMRNMAVYRSSLTSGDAAEFNRIWNLKNAEEGKSSKETDTRNSRAVQMNHDKGKSNLPTGRYIMSELLRSNAEAYSLHPTKTAFMVCCSEPPLSLCFVFAASCQFSIKYLLYT